MSAALLRQSFEAGTTIIKEGDKGNVFYIIEEGSIDVTKGGEFLRNMKPGSFFGEQALVKKEARSATCVAKTACTLLAMDRESFENLFGPLEVGSIVFTGLIHTHTHTTPPALLFINPWLTCRYGRQP